MTTSPVSQTRAAPLLSRGQCILFGGLLALPFFEMFFDLGLSAPTRFVFVFAIVGIGLNVVVGFTGLLHLGIAAFMAIGAYTFGILTCTIYPFQIGFWPGLLAALLFGAAAGAFLGAPTLRLRGDYLAIVTLGFGEIVQDLLKNLEPITKGTQGINPLPTPWFFGAPFASDTPKSWYFLFLGILLLCTVLVRNLEHSRIGRQWFAVREDELAARCMAIRPDRVKLVALAVGGGLAALGGAMLASLISSTGEPGNYDFQISILALCIVIVGGIGSMTGVIVGALVMVGMNSILLPLIGLKLQQAGIGTTMSVYLAPDNYKYMLFGLALVLMMRFRPKGIVAAEAEDH